MQLKITTTGKIVRAGLADFSAEIPKISRQQLRAMIERIKRRMQEYPPEPAGQSLKVAMRVVGTAYKPARKRYVRTGLFGASWKVDNLENGYRISNIAQRKGRQYGVFVVGDAYGLKQAWMHQGRWQVFRDVADDEMRKMPPEIEKTLRTAMRKHKL